MKTVLVTGGAGFIGSHLCDRLIELKYNVICVDNLSNGSLNNISHLLNNLQFKFYELDINELDISFFEKHKIELVCHQAAIGSVPRSIISPELYQQSNVDGFFHILNLSRLALVRRIVYASSSSVYGSDTNLPKIETSTGIALSPYAATKQINELYAKTFSGVYGIETVGLRYFNVFGPRQNPNGDYAAVIPKFINQIFANESPTINGDGSYSRDFTYVNNIVDANILALESDLINKHYCFNIGAGGKTSILELFNLISQKINSKIEFTQGKFRKGDIPHSFANISLARNTIGYEPKFDISKGLDETIDYFKRISYI